MFDQKDRKRSPVRTTKTSLVITVLSFVLTALFSAPDSVNGADGSRVSHYYKIGDWDKVIAEYKTVAQPQPSADTLTMVAEAYYYMGQLDRAEDAAEKAVRISDSIDSQIIRALVKARGEPPRKAVQQLESLKRGTREDHKIFTGIGIIKSYQNWDDALVYYKKAVETEPDDFRAWFNMGLIYEERESFEEASRAYKNAVRANPFFAQAQNNLGYTYKERHFYAYAVEHYLKAIDLMPDNAGFYYNIGNAYTHQEKIDEAFDAYKKALELMPTFAKAHYNMARTYLRKDMVKEAIEEFRLYLKYGDKAVFAYVAPEDIVEEEIDELELYLRQNAQLKPRSREIAR